MLLNCFVVVAESSLNNSGDTDIHPYARDRRSKAAIAIVDPAAHERNNNALKAWLRVEVRHMPLTDEHVDRRASTCVFRST